MKKRTICTTMIVSNGIIVGGCGAFPNFIIDAVQESAKESIEQLVDEVVDDLLDPANLPQLFDNEQSGN